MIQRIEAFRHANACSGCEESPMCATFQGLKQHAQTCIGCPECHEWRRLSVWSWMAERALVDFSPNGEVANVQVDHDLTQPVFVDLTTEMDEIIDLTGDEEEVSMEEEEVKVEVEDSEAEEEEIEEDDEEEEEEAVEEFPPFNNTPNAELLEKIRASDPEIIRLANRWETRLYADYGSKHEGVLLNRMFTEMLLDMGEQVETLPRLVMVDSQVSASFRSCFYDDVRVFLSKDGAHTIAFSIILKHKYDRQIAEERGWNEWEYTLRDGFQSLIKGTYTLRADYHPALKPFHQTYWGTCIHHPSMVSEEIYANRRALLADGYKLNVRTVGGAWPEEARHGTMERYQKGKEWLYVIAIPLDCDPPEGWEKAPSLFSIQLVTYISKKFCK